MEKIIQKFIDLTGKEKKDVTLADIIKFVNPTKLSLTEAAIYRDLTTGDFETVAKLLEGCSAKKKVAKKSQEKKSQSGKKEESKED